MTSDLIQRATQQMIKAIRRGDLDAAFAWTFIIDRQLDIIGRLVSLDETDRRLRRYRNDIAAMRVKVLAHLKRARERRMAPQEAGKAAKPDSR